MVNWKKKTAARKKKKITKLLPEKNQPHFIRKTSLMIKFLFLLGCRRTLANDERAKKPTNHSLKQKVRKVRNIKYLLKYTQKNLGGK